MSYIANGSKPVPADRGPASSGSAPPPAVIDSVEIGHVPSTKVTVGI